MSRLLLLTALLFIGWTNGDALGTN
uniref:Uncharacterized protein n=1 Tax=Triticum urartu TaxID=4572 RepID=A0A8R7PNQ6_TRIUA